jgi:hypothetical protein
MDLGIIVRYPWFGTATNCVTDSFALRLAVVPCQVAVDSGRMQTAEKSIGAAEQPVPRCAHSTNTSMTSSGLSSEASRSLEYWAGGQARNV